MARKKNVDKKVKDKVIAPKEDNIEALEKKIADKKATQKAKEVKKAKVLRKKLIDLIRPKLLSNKQLKQGSSATRMSYEKEKQEMGSLMIEVNRLGKIIGLRDIGLGHLRG